MPVLGGSVGQDLSNGTGSLAANTSIKIIQVMKDKKVALHKLSEDVVAADGANIQENIKRLFVIMQDLELELRVQSDELIKAIIRADSTQDAANGDHILDEYHRRDAVKDGNGRNCAPKKAGSSTRKSDHERAVPPSSSRKSKVESESETTEGESTRRHAKRTGKAKANQATKDIPCSQPSTFNNNNPFALHAFPMPIFPPYYPPYYPCLHYHSQAMWTMPPPPLFFGGSMPSVNTYWTHNVNSNNFTRTAVNNSGNDHSMHETYRSTSVPEHFLAGTN